MCQSSLFFFRATANVPHANIKATRSSFRSKIANIWVRAQKRQHCSKMVSMWSNLRVVSSDSRLLASCLNVVSLLFLSDLALKSSL